MSTNNIISVYIIAIEHRAHSGLRLGSGDAITIESRGKARLDTSGLDPRDVSNAGPERFLYLSEDPQRRDRRRRGNGTARLHFEIGARCMGMPDTDPQEKLRAILSLEELDCLINRLLDVESGEDLLR